MTPLRRGLGLMTAIWLFCQLATMASVPVVVWLSAANSHATRSHATECTCGHEVGAMCPMHHGPTRDPGRCVVQAANSQGTAVLTTLVGIGGFVPEPTLSIRSADRSMHSLPADVHVVGERPVPPDPPPPRA